MSRQSEKQKKNTGREAPELSSGIPAKLIQYLMLIMLLVLVFLVSAYAGLAGRGKDKGGEAAERMGTTESTGGDSGTDGGTDRGNGLAAAEDKAAGKAGGNGNQDDSDQGDGNQDDSNQGDGNQDDSNQGDGNQGGSEKKTDTGKKGTIVLDAGHGGFDPGVSGSSGVAERELNLIFARKLEALLEEEGYHVVQTRPTEAGLYDEDQAHKKAQDMQRRCAVIEAAQPLATISIHQNSYPDSSVSGPQVFYYAQSKEGEQLASCIQECMNEQLEVERPKSHKGNESYYILKRSVGTAVIVECGFLTNPDEEQKLQDEAYQNRAVRAICDGILKYLESAAEK